MGETLKPTPKEATQPEVREMRIVSRVELIRRNPEYFYETLTEEIDPGNLTIAEIASATTPDKHGYIVVGIRTFQRVEGEVLVGGEPVGVSSNNLYDPSTIYIDGEVTNIDRAIRFENDHENIEFLEERDDDPKWKMVIKTRTGHYHPFGKKDQVIKLSKMVEQPTS